MAFAGWSDTTARNVTGSSTLYGFLMGPGAAFSTEGSRQQIAPIKFNSGTEPKKGDS